MIALLNYRGRTFEYNFQCDEDEFPEILRFMDYTFFTKRMAFKLETVSGGNVAYYKLIMEEL